MQSSETATVTVTSELSQLVAFGDITGGKENLEARVPSSRALGEGRWENGN
jgi:hypothetical protein